MTCIGRLVNLTSTIEKRPIMHARGRVIGSLHNVPEEHQDDGYADQDTVFHCAHQTGFAWVGTRGRHSKHDDINNAAL